MDLQKIQIGVVAWCVIGTLLVMSVLSIGIMAERLWTYRRASRRTRTVLPEVSRLLQQGKLDAVIALSRAPEAQGAHVVRVLSAGISAWRDRNAEAAREDAVDSVRYALEDATAGELAYLRERLSMLATIGSTAPFVGLFGTTFGIINAFNSIAITGAGGISVISGGIAEALLTTAFGLFVAIPAVWAYNLLGSKVDAFSIELDRSRYQLLSWVQRS